MYETLLQPQCTLHRTRILAVDKVCERRVVRTARQHDNGQDCAFYAGLTIRARAGRTLFSGRMQGQHDDCYGRQLTQALS